MPESRDSQAASCSASGSATAREAMPPHNLTLTLIGASLLWVGWFGFNAGSATAADGRAGMAMLATQMATGAAALGWMFAEWFSKGKPSVLGIASGAVAGLVAITPASGYVGPSAAVIIGLAAGVVCYFAATSHEAHVRLRRFAGRFRRARHRRDPGRAAHGGVREQGDQRRGRLAPHPVQGRADHGRIRLRRELCDPRGHRQAHRPAGDRGPGARRPRYFAARRKLE